MNPSELTVLSKAWEEVKKRKQEGDFFEVPPSSVEPEQREVVVKCHGIHFIKSIHKIRLKTKEKEEIRYFCIDKKLKQSVPESVLSARGFGYKSTMSFFKALNFYFDSRKKYSPLDT